MLRRPGDTLSPGPTVVASANHSPATTIFDKEIVTSRPSRGLEQFFVYQRGQAGLSILDLAGASQENISYLTSLGHKVYSEDLVRGLNAIGSTPRDIIAILQSLKAAGALEAEVEVI